MIPLLLTSLLLTAAEPQAQAKADAPERAEAVAVLSDALAAGDADLSAAAERAADVLGDDWRANEKLRQAADAEDVADRLNTIRLRLGFSPAGEAQTPPDWPAFTVVDEIEVKQYPAYRMAVAESGASGEAGQSRLFFTLFDHIQSNDIPMTAPVEMTRDGGRTTSMAFLYPTADTGSPGESGGVTVVDVEPVAAVSLGVLGPVTAEVLADAERDLRAWLDAGDAYEAAGDLRVLGYNGPMVPSPLRFSEVQIPVKPAEKAAASCCGG